MDIMQLIQPLEAALQELLDLQNRLGWENQEHPFREHADYKHLHDHMYQKLLSGEVTKYKAVRWYGYIWGALSYHDVKELPSVSKWITEDLVEGWAKSSVDFVQVAEKLKEMHKNAGKLPENEIIKSLIFASNKGTVLDNFIVGAAQGLLVAEGVSTLEAVKQINFTMQV